MKMLYLIYPVSVRPLCTTFVKKDFISTKILQMKMDKIECFSGLAASQTPLWLIYFPLPDFNHIFSLEQLSRESKNSCFLFTCVTMQLIKTLLSGEGNVLLTVDNVQPCHKLAN